VGMLAAGRDGGGKDNDSLWWYKLGIELELYG